MKEHGSISIWPTMAFDFDGDPISKVSSPSRTGRLSQMFAMKMSRPCPAIAMDTDGYKPEPIPENDEDILEGRETSQFRSLIYWNGLWTDLHTYLMDTFDFPDGGDFIMRLVIEAQWEEDDEEILG